MVLTYPLMAAIQEISARIGRVTGAGIAANLRKNYPRPLLYCPPKGLPHSSDPIRQDGLQGQVLPTTLSRLE